MKIPLVFDGRQGDTAGLTIGADADGSTVNWPELGISISHKGTADEPDFSDVGERTPQLRIHGRTGLTIDNYSEFLLQDLMSMDEFRFGSVEVSFGHPTPLFRYMFERYRHRKYMGEWSDLTSCRILGAHPDDVELVLLNAFNKYEERHDVLPQPSEILEFDWVAWEASDEEETEEEEEEEGAVFDPAIPSDVEPLRCFFYAKSAADPAAACIQFYRVLEFYAFLSLTRSLSALRRDANVSDREFLFKSAQLLSKDEQSSIVRLVVELSTKELLDFAAGEGLITRSDRSLLGSSLYQFRNSIVHAKQDQRAPVTVDSIIGSSSTTKAWKRVLQQLAQKALGKHSSVRHLT
ncbi:hypothetical protein [Mitsuaria sp. 7]|uniref:hypothetical protein n=1 Tax=Mitsuaria sp. 7 TaxID=1658665 RepID=UPI0007DD3D81|nr:hypothetical protein [Mitsuaria sp. 7]ANH69204.1 hypothetical protein ABE85_19465 [Mitsuaria sp. 7]